MKPDPVHLRLVALAATIQKENDAIRRRKEAVLDAIRKRDAAALEAKRLHDEGKIGAARKALATAERWHKKSESLKAKV